MEVAVPRVLVVCKGGPYDGEVFSVAKVGRKIPAVEGLPGMKEGSSYAVKGKQRKLTELAESFDSSHNLRGEYTAEYTGG